jgi:hypothetical protein
MWRLVAATITRGRAGSSCELGPVFRDRRQLCLSRRVDSRRSIEDLTVEALKRTLHSRHTAATASCRADWPMRAAEPDAASSRFRASAKSAGWSLMRRSRP